MWAGLPPFAHAKFPNKEENVLNMVTPPPKLIPTKPTDHEGASHSSAAATMWLKVVLLGVALCTYTTALTTTTTSNCTPPDSDFNPCTREQTAVRRDAHRMHG